ncbi:hypothetical protein lerEdw1_020496 [Lerista edwardsae]|nr:hypothetical protein lerEdw1_020496 [Lerista edwardsae]
MHDLVSLQATSYLSKMEKNTTTIPLTENLSDKKPTVCIFGTGDFGRSLGTKILQCGYSVVFGSRSGQASGLIPKGATVLPHAEAAETSDLIVIAVHRIHYSFLEGLKEVLHGKVLVDVSNNLKINQYPESNAEYLAQLLPGSKVVKAFNTVSAWALQSGALDASRQVFVCGDNSKSKDKVMDIVRSLGLTPLDKGSLLAAKEIENYPLQLFPMWRYSIYFSLGLSAFFFLYCVIREVIYSQVENEKDVSFRIVITIPNRVCPVVALILLALVYLPGIFAAILQLHRGTKYSRFPDWLDQWMLCRKQLGLVALAFAFLHVLYTLVIPIRYYVRWRIGAYILEQAFSNRTDPFDVTNGWISDSYVSMGILGFFFFLLLGITSLPSVSNSVNWREFRFVQVRVWAHWVAHWKAHLPSLFTHFWAHNNDLHLPMEVHQEDQRSLHRLKIHYIIILLQSLGRTLKGAKPDLCLFCFPKDGQIDADELQRCLTQSGVSGAYKPFNLETCRLMISMLDYGKLFGYVRLVKWNSEEGSLATTQRDMSGTMGFNEFKELWAVLNGWRQHFMSVDSDHSGTVDSQELQKALVSMGFRFGPQTVNAIAKRYSSRGKISFDDYIACCVKLRALTDSFRRRDAAQQGMVNFQYDDVSGSKSTGLDAVHK